MINVDTYRTHTLCINPLKNKKNGFYFGTERVSVVGYYFNIFRDLFIF